MKQKCSIYFLFSIIFFHTTTQTIPLINLSVAKDRVEKYYESGEYDKDLNRIIAEAKKTFATIPATKKSVVIFDVDDTVLSDYADAKSIDFGYIPKLSHEWVLRADAPGISQVKELYDYLVQRGFTIIFMTGRKHNEYDATIKNLKRQGFDTFERLIVRSKEEHNLPAETYKSNRRKQLVKEGYTIVGNIGDQDSDLDGGNSGYAVKLPNYRYLIP